MLERVLRHFPPHSHALTLVSDPDGVLGEEEVRVALAERGFSILAESDPVQLRHRVARFGDFSPGRPLIVVTPDAVNKLAYDLWQQGHPVALDLHHFFPTLSYPVVQSLTPDQRWRLAQAAPPGRTLARQASLDFVLRHVFDLDWAAVAQPAGLVGWLNQYHTGPRGPLPPLLAQHWLARLEGWPKYRDWPVTALLNDHEAFRRFVAEQWQGYVVKESGQAAGKMGVRYLLPFDQDETLQDTLPQLVRRGALRPITVADSGRLPGWAQVAVVDDAAGYTQQRVGELLDLLTEQAADLTTARWANWQAIALTWAELTTLRYQPETPFTAGQRATYQEWQARLDAAFLDWLRQRYQPLSGQRLPQPHHLYHAPHFLAYERRQGRAGRVALLVLDGMSLAAWRVIGAAWRQRHLAWRLDERLLLAQIPTITAISRQALVSGQRPADFADTLDNNEHEARQWAQFWSRHNLAAERCVYGRLAPGRPEVPDAAGNGRVQALCLIHRDLDEMTHATTLGLAGFHSSLQLWLNQQSPALEDVIAALLAQAHTVYLTSDHGHTEAVGMGQPAEGLTAQMRAKRARIYSTELAATAVKSNYPDTILWHDTVLPAGAWVLMPLSHDGRRLAFAHQNTVVVTHGGLTLDEVVVPFVRITAGD